MDRHWQNNQRWALTHASALGLRPEATHGLLVAIKFCPRFNVKRTKHLMPSYTQTLIPLTRNTTINPNRFAASAIYVDHRLTYDRHNRYTTLQRETKWLLLILPCHRSWRWGPTHYVGLWWWSFRNCDDCDAPTPTHIFFLHLLNSALIH